jgi:hypothetical protein
MPLDIDSMHTRLLGSGTLEVRDVHAADMGWYTCMAHSYDGATNVTAAAYLKVIGMCAQLLCV